MSSVIFVEMDVHKNSFNLCALDGRIGEMQYSSDDKIPVVLVDLKLDKQKNFAVE